MTLTIYLFLFSFLKVEACMSEKMDGMIIRYSTVGDVKNVMLYYSKDGKEFHPIAYRPNYGPGNPHEGKFYWVFPHSNWRGGYIKAVAYGLCGNVLEEKVIEVGKSNGIKRSSVTRRAIKDDGQLENTFNKGTFSEDPYAWRMVGYDARHTGYYPYPLYPPLELEWTYTGEGADFMMLSGCAGNGMLYMPGGTSDEGGWRRAQILAMDIETGEIVWKRTLTSNVWAAALSPGDSLLFVGTSIEPSLTQPTFFCLDARTGEIKWSKFLWSVGVPIVITDQIVLAGNWVDIYALNYSGEILWGVYGDTSVFPPIGIDRAPAVNNNKVYVGGENSALLALDAFTGDTLWVFPTPGWVDTDPLVYNEGVIFASQHQGEGTLYCLNTETGLLTWEIGGISATSPYRLSVCNAKIFLSLAYWGGEVPVYSVIYSFDFKSGKLLWERTIGGQIAMTSIPLTSNEILWAANDYIYGLSPSTGEVVFSSSEAVPDNYKWPSHYWPIVYKNYLIGAHRSLLYVYKGKRGDTCQPFMNVYPNPFNSVVFFPVNVEGEVSIKIYDVMGCAVKSLFRGHSSGGLVLTWDGRDKRGERVSSGVYFVVLRKNGRVLASQKVVYLNGGR